MNKKSKKEEHSTISLPEVLCTVSLPEELMLEILLRLPVRSVLRFGCVCNSWLSLLSTPQFAQSHFDLAAAPSHRLLLSVTSDRTGDFVKSIDPEASLEDRRSAVLHLRLPPLILPDLSNCLKVCGSCRGFVLLYQFVSCFSLRSFDQLLVWNPLTGIHKQIPPHPHVDEVVYSDCGFGFGYDASTDDYLVIRIDFVLFKTAVIIKSFSCKSNTWDCYYIETKHSYKLNEGFNFRAGSFLNGALHWSVISGRDMDIIAFDLVERSLSEIPMPPVLSQDFIYRWNRHGLRVIGGCLGVWVEAAFSNGRNELWMMKEYKVLSSWTKSFDFVGDDPPRYLRFSPICLTKDNALFGSDLRHKRLLKLCCKTNNWLKGTFTYGKGRDLHNCNLHGSLYRESLLQLPNDTE